MINPIESSLHNPHSHPHSHHRSHHLNHYRHYQNHQNYSVVVQTPRLMLLKLDQRC